MPDAQKRSNKPSPRYCRILLRSGLALPAFLLLLWWWGSRSGWWSPYILPSPSVVMKSFVSMAMDGSLLRNAAASILRIVKGFSVSLAAAVSIAFACGAYAPLMRQLSPTLEFLRHIPPMATIPMLILWFGIGETSKIVIIVLAAFFPIFLNTAKGIEESDAGLVEVASLFGYDRFQVLWYVAAPSALPYILTGMRLGLGYSWRSLIAAELLAASSGLGYLILDAEQLARPDAIMVGILVIGALGSAMDVFLSKLAGRLVRYSDISV